MRMQAVIIPSMIIKLLATGEMPDLISEPPGSRFDGFWWRPGMVPQSF